MKLLMKPEIAPASKDYYDDDTPSSGSGRRRKNLDSTIDKLLDSKERL